MVESTGLEIRRSRKATEGSNPSLSAIRRASLAHGQDHSPLGEQYEMRAREGWRMP